MDGESFESVTLLPLSSAEFYCTFKDRIGYAYVRKMLEPPPHTHKSILLKPSVKKIFAFHQDSSFSQKMSLAFL